MTVSTASWHLEAGLGKAPGNGLVPLPEYLLEDVEVVAARRMRKLQRQERGMEAEQQRLQQLQLNCYHHCYEDDDARKWMLRQQLQMGHSFRVRWYTEVGRRSRHRKGWLQLRWLERVGREQ